MSARAITTAERAVLYTLETAQRDHEGLGYHLGPGTQAYRLLCAAEAEITGETPEAVEARRAKLPPRGAR